MQEETLQRQRKEKLQITDYSRTTYTRIWETFQY